MFKLLALKIAQSNRGATRLARTSLHVLPLGQFNCNVEATIEEINGLTKILSCAGNKPDSIVSNVLRIFSKAKNEEFWQVVNSYARGHD